MERILFTVAVLIIALAGNDLYYHGPEKFASFYYIQISPGTYIRTTTMPSTLNCRNETPNPSWLEYDSDKSESFPSYQIPTGYIKRSEVNGIYVE